MRDLMKSRLCLSLGVCLAISIGVRAFAPEKPLFFRARTIGDRIEWRFRPLLVDLNKDGHVDLVANARLADPALHIWFGDGKSALDPMKATWTDIGYGALATGDINGDGFPDIVSASHFGRIQTLLSDGKGGFTEKVVRGNDGYVAAQLADLNGDGHLDLVLVGYDKAGIEIYFGDGTGNWTLEKSLPESKPDPTMAGRDLVVADLNHDGRVDIVAAFQRWGLYVYYGDGRGGFAGGSVSFRRAADTPEALALADVENDGNPDIVVTGGSGRSDELNGPDVYLGDGRGGWKASSSGLKVLKYMSPAIALGDLDRDGHLDIVAGGNITGDVGDGYGLFWFRGDGRGNWSLVEDCGFPVRGLSEPQGLAIADLDGDGLLEVVVLSGRTAGSITVWKRAPALATEN